MITLVVFSKDRAMQLDSLLRSVEDHCTGIDRIVVVARASTPSHREAYLDLDEDLHCGGVLDTNGNGLPGDELWFQGDDEDQPLGSLVQEACTDTKYVAFAVDDMVFYRPSDFVRASTVLDTVPGFVWSWRHGADRLHSVRAGSDFWRGPAGYAWHVDGSLYRGVDYLRTLDRFYPNWREAQTPNDLEGTVAMRADEWALGITHLGPLEPTCMTWQINQAYATPGVRRAPFAAVPGTQLDALAEAYIAGRRVDNEKLYADLSWTTRFQKHPGKAHVEACEEAATFYASLIR